ncbi:MAG TPA: hypothetical protein VFG11_11920 [Acidobacteriota bacterium]|nr:hypothetical protein [Acidobacteriota bacterium]
MKYGSPLMAGALLMWGWTFWYANQMATKKTETPVEQNQTVAPINASAAACNSFEPVKNLLANRCAPCHVPGGKMYERLPWDNPEVVKAHKDGILRRLKTPEDKQILEQWLAQ